MTEVIQITSIAVTLAVAVLAARLAHVYRRLERRSDREIDAAGEFLAAYSHAYEAVVTMVHANVSATSLDYAREARSRWLATLQRDAGLRFSILRLVASDRLVRPATEMQQKMHKGFRAASDVVEFAESGDEARAKEGLDTARRLLQEMKSDEDEFCRAAHAG